MTMVENKQMDDLLLIEQFKSGRQSAFDSLMKRYHPVVLNTCFRILQDEQNARDAAQDIFIKVYRALSDWQPHATLKTWMYRITVNHCLNVLRSQKRRRFLVSLNQLLTGNQEPTIIDGESHPDHALQNMELSNAVFKALDGLKPEYKTVIVLHRMEGLSYKEIAEIMNTSVASVESRMHRARARLADILAEYR